MASNELPKFYPNVSRLTILKYESEIYNDILSQLQRCPKRDKVYVLSINYFLSKFVSDCFQLPRFRSFLYHSYNPPRNYTRNLINVKFLRKINKILLK